MARSDAVIQTALAQFSAGDPAGAKAALRAFLAKFPGDAPALKAAAMIHGALREDAEALGAITRASMVDPKNAELHFMRANVLMILKRYKESAEGYRTVIRLAPGEVVAYDALARCLLSLDDERGADEQYERSLTIAPDNEDVYKRYAATLSIVGRIADSIRITRRGLERLPESAALLEQLCYNANFADDIDPVWHREQHAALGRLVARRATRPARPITRDRTPGRPLNVAFLSGDFAMHACAFFLEGLLRELNPSRVRSFSYYTRPEADEGTPRFHNLGTFRHVPDLTPEQLADLCEHDRIDIAIDCSGWTDRGNMRLLVPRVAPVQATYLGYPNTTGLPTIDFRIVDPLTDPPGSESHCTERLARLDRCLWVFQPMDAPDPSTIPAPHQADPSGPVVFGSFNRVTKVADATLRLWARVLGAVPGSRLLVKAQVAFGVVQKNFMRRLEAMGVTPDRILISEYVEKLGAHMPLYRRMDIALDSFPYNGTTTTCESLWMGVPVIALAGNSHRSRVGVSLLSAVGAPELIARDEDEYVRIASELAADRRRLSGYHAVLRSQMAASPLMDARAYARSFEGCLHGVWASYLAGEIPS